MSLQTALVAIKTANATLNTLVGTRFYPDGCPQEVELPAVTFQVISRPRTYCFAGTPQLSHPRVQFDGYVQSRRSGGAAGGRETLASAIRGAFNRYNGTIGGRTIQDIRIDNEFESLDQVDADNEVDRITIDMIVDLVEV